MHLYRFIYLVLAKIVDPNLSEELAKNTIFSFDYIQ